MSVKEELNKPELIPSKWNRNTVADGTWLQKHTLDKLKERDDFLADAIDNLSGNTDTNLSGLSAAIDYVSGSYSSFYTNEYLQFKEDVESSAAQFDTDLQTEINDRIEKDEYHDEAIETIKNQIDTMNAATDVVDVWGTYSAFSADWRETYFPGGSALITNNDIIKIINDEYTEVEDNLTTGHQTYFRWVCNDPVPSGPDDGQWEYIGYTDPYYNRTEVDDKILGIENTIIDLSGTVADNYLSAKGAVHQGHNIKVTEQTDPVIEIATKDNVDFTELSADTAWVDTISANVSAFDFYETTSGKRLSETQQGLFINTTASPFDPTKSASEGDVFWPANFEQIFSAWYDTDKLINIKYTNDFNITRLYTLHNVRQYTENDVTFYDLNFISNDDKVAYTAYAKVKRNGGEGGGAPTAPVLYACDEGPIDVEYTGENGVYVSGDHKVGLSSTYETALKEGSAASAWIDDNESKIAYTADFKGTNGVVTGYGTSAFAGGISSISAKTGNSTALFTGYNVSLQAGEGVGFNYGTNLLTISADGKTYAPGNYIQISGNNNSINVTTPLVNSASSGYSAYDWITTKSATLSAGSGINFNSAAPNTLGISVNYTTTNGYVTELNGVPLSAGANYSQGRCTTIDGQNKINLSSDINLDTKLVIDHYNSSEQESYASANLESYKLDFSGSRDSGGSYRNQSATYSIYQLKIDNYSDEDNLHFADLDYNGLQISAHSKYGGYTVNTYTNITNDYYETQLAESPSNYYLKFDGKYISAGSNSSNVTAANWASIVSAANGKFVSATSQEIVVNAPYQTQFVVTATIPGSLNANTYYII